MFEFKVLKQSKKSKARLGILKTDHGEVMTPCFVPVATNAVVKTLDSREVKETKSQILICNTFHLENNPGSLIVKKNGGLHGFGNFDIPLMTDSGGFQVFSLGFGKDYDLGKILKKKTKERIVLGDKPKLLRINDEGVLFKSMIDGKEVFLTPEKSIKIQENLKADIIFSFDECTPPIADYNYTLSAMKRTHAWAERCLKAKKSSQALYGVVQGGKFKDLRKESAKVISSFAFSGFGIGGEFGDNKKTMVQMINIVKEELDFLKPVHLLGIGHLEDIELIIKSGIDTFDCIIPTRYGRHGIAFTSKGRLDLKKAVFLKDKKPIDKQCSCFVCKEYKRSYISHLFRAKEETAKKLLTFHNLYFFNSYLEILRERIKRGSL